MDAINELQENTVEMERNRVIPELIGLFNAENEVHQLIPNTKYMTKLIGTNNKRVITMFNPSESIRFNALDTSNAPLIADANTADLTTVSNDRENLEEPLHWDQNWEWDF